MKILHLITSSNFGGAEQYLLHLIKEQKRQGHKIYLYRHLFGRRDDEAAEVAEADVKIHVINSVSPWHLIRLCRLIRREKIDIIHTHLAKASVLGGIAGRLCRKPVIATVHGLNKGKDYRFSTALIAVSRAVREHLAGKGRCRKQIHVIHSGIPDPGVQKKTFLKDRTLRLLFAGRLSREKGIDLLLARLASFREAPWTLTIAGEGNQKDELISICRDLKIEERVFFKGFVPDMGPLFLEHDCLVLPSRKEGFGLVIIEAFARGVPVLAAATGGIREIITPGSGGLLYEREDKNSFESAFTELLGRDNLLRLGEAAYRSYKKRFTTEMMSEQVMEVYGKYL